VAIYVICELLPWQCLSYLINPLILLGVDSIEIIMTCVNTQRVSLLSGKES